MKEGTPILEMQGITKRFHGVPALQNVNLTIFPGEIHALMGENGAGKSTLMKILAGAIAADEGKICINGMAVDITNPSQARGAGITLIYQELNLAPNLSVAENIFMGSELAQAGIILARERMRSQAAVVLENLGASFAPDDLVSTLSIASQQQVEIARALKDRSRILVMDEPTAALSERETERLFQVIRKLQNDGIAIIYISHRMEEVLLLANRISVLRDGEYVGTLEQGESPHKLIQMMVGRSLQDFYEHKAQKTLGAVMLEVTDLSDGRKIKPTSFQLHAGEIVGLAGLVGAGRTELARLIFGADSSVSGEVKLAGQKLKNFSPADAIASGIAYVPEDRKQQGLFLEMSACNNITMNVFPRESKAGIVNWQQIGKIAAGAVKKFSIRGASLSTRAMDLSGGNQQKLLLSRWLEINPKILLLDEPTRGVDIGAKQEIYHIIGNLARQGVAILMISSELPEIVGMSDRVLVMREGRLVGELGGSSRKEITPQNIMALATGAAQV